MRTPGALCWTNPYHSGRITRGNVCEEVRILEERLGRGGVKDHFSGGKKGVGVS
jgi:hypothetical protein